MNAKLILATKYVFLAFTAFVVPKLIVDSGRLVAPLEPRKPNGVATGAAQNGADRSFWPFVALSRSLDADVAPDFVDRERSFVGSGAINPAFGNGSVGENARFGEFNDRFNNRFGVRNGGGFPENAAAFRTRSANFGKTADLADSTDSAIAERRRAANFFAPETDAPPNPFLAESAFESAALAPTPRKSLDEIFRFGRSPAWFVENWARVDAAPSEDGLLGYRVAVSTGSGVDDLTGVLTCYFDATSDRRVVFSGQTGDYRKTLRFLEREFGVELSPSSTAARLEYVSTLRTSGNAPPSRFVVRPTQVFLRGAEKSFFNVDVVLERPYN